MQTLPRAKKVKEARGVFRHGAFLHLSSPFQSTDAAESYTSSQLKSKGVAMGPRGAPRGGPVECEPLAPLFTGRVPRLSLILCRRQKWDKMKEYREQDDSESASAINSGETNRRIH